MDGLFLSVGGLLVGLFAGVFDGVGGALRGAVASAQAALPVPVLAAGVFLLLLGSAWFLAKR